MNLISNGTCFRPGLGRAPSRYAIGLTLALLVTPFLLPAQTLQHRYSFVSDASDSVGTANGTIVAPNGGSPATISNGLELPGNPGGGNGVAGYVSLPAGLLTTTTNLTIECWVTQNAANTWATVWDFANNTSQNFSLCPFPNRNNGQMMSAFVPNNNEDDLFSDVTFPNGSETYVALTVNASDLLAVLYTNAVSVGTLTLPNSTFIPGQIGGSGGTSINALGNDIWGDPQFSGTLYELRIWNGVVSERYLQASAVAGPSVVINNLTPTSTTVAAGTNMVLTGTEQAVVTVQLPQTGSTNLLATSDATNWVSSNPNVLTVNSSGLISAVGVGSATVSAKVGGVSGTSGSITVTPQTLLHRYSFVSDASDSVGGANGTVVPASANGTNVTISNGLILPGGGGGGYSGYVTLPADILTNASSLTVECWVTQNQGNTWAELWDFANNGSQNFGLIPDPANNGTHTEVAFTPNGGEVDLQSSITFPNNSEQYVAVTYNNSTLVGNLYTNGALIATQNFPSTAYDPSTFGGGTTVNALGNDIYNDTQFQGTIYEFRIWNGAVSPAYLEASAAAGPGIVITNEIPQSLAISLSTTSMVGAGTQQAMVLGNLLQVSGVNFTGAATNWVSSNPNVLSVNSSGLITAINGGSATVSATVDGVTATSASITVASTPPVLPQKPANLIVAVNDTATFSVGALGGNLSYQWSFDSMPIAGATNATLVLTNVSLAQAGTYSITVTNTLGTTNASATLTVDQAILEHRYSFASDASDSVGGANGTIVAPGNAGGQPATISNGLSLPGNTVNGGGFGYSGYVALPSGLLTNTTSLTIECWFTQNSPNTWATVWDFADNGNINFELCPAPASGRNNGNMIVAFTPNGNENDLDSDVTFPSGSEEYVALTVNAPELLGSLYTNATLVGTVTLPNASYLPGAIGGSGGTVQDMLGNDTFGDFQFSGTIYEFRIWDGAVTPLYLAVSSVAGPGVVVNNLTPTSLSITVTNSTMVAGQSQPVSVTGNFAQASGVALNFAATNWVSSNTNVLTVSSSGVVTAVGTGSATISATVNGFTGTSASISVPNSPPIITLEPAAALNLLAGATLTASVANIGTAPFTYYWYTNNGVVPISVSASPTLTVPNVQLANAASYTVVISNAYGTNLSSPLVLSVSTPTAYQQTLLDYGALAYWPLNESSGNVAYDMIGGNNGTYNGGFSLGNPGPANAFFGSASYAAGFDGSTAYVDIPEGPFNITGAITVVAWVQLAADNGFDGLFGHGDPSWRLSVNGSGDPGANDGGPPSDATSPTSINDGNWHMVAYTYTGKTNQVNNGSLYVDGSLVANNSVFVTPAGDNLDVWIGGSPDYGTGANKRLIAANIADAAVFTTSFTSAQVTGLYNGMFVQGPVYLTITNTPAGVVLTWPTGTLLQATNLLGPWTTDAAAASPYTVQATNKNAFFKVLVNP